MKVTLAILVAVSSVAALGVVGTADWRLFLSSLVFCVLNLLCLRATPDFPASFRRRGGSAIVIAGILAFCCFLALLLAGLMHIIMAFQKEVFFPRSDPWAFSSWKSDVLGAAPFVTVLLTGALLIRNAILAAKMSLPTYRRPRRLVALVLSIPSILLAVLFGLLCALNALLPHAWGKQHPWLAQIIIGPLTSTVVVRSAFVLLGLGVTALVPPLSLFWRGVICGAGAGYRVVRSYTIRYVEKARCWSQSHIRPSTDSGRLSRRTGGTYSYSPVSEINGISKKRALVLARLDIYSVRELVEAVPDDNALKDMAIRLGVSERTLEGILAAARRIVDEPPRRARTTAEITIPAAAIAVGTVLLGFGIYAHSAHFTDSLLVWQTIHIYEDHEEDEWKEKFYRWTVRTDISPMQDDGRNLVVHTISRSWSESMPDIAASFPHGVLIQNHMDNYDVVSGTALLIHVLRGTVPTKDAGWVTQKVLKETPLELPLLTHHYKEINEVMGESFLFELPDLTTQEPRVDPENHYRLEIVIKLRSSDKMPRIRKYAKGTMSAKIWLDIGEYQFEEIGRQPPWPGLFLREKRREHQNFHVYANWHPPCAGRFVFPDAVVSKGEASFFDMNRSLKEELVYHTFGSMWVAYLAAIMSVPLMGWGGARLWKAR